MIKILIIRTRDGMIRRIAISGQDCMDAETTTEIIKRLAPRYGHIDSYAWEATTRIEMVRIFSPTQEARAEVDLSVAVSSTGPDSA